MTLHCKTIDGLYVNVTFTDDCEPNVGGYYCQIYLDDAWNCEVDNMVIPASIVDKGKEEEYAREHVAALALFGGLHFFRDNEKMQDFIRLTKEEFLASYSYLTEQEYNNTQTLYKYSTFEWCPYCEEEVVLQDIFEVQVCPSCGELLAPCSLCETRKCNTCSAYNIIFQTTIKTN